MFVLLTLLIALVDPALAERPFLTYYGDPGLYGSDPAFGISVAYGDSFGAHVPVLVVGSNLSDPDDDTEHSNDGEAFVLGSPFSDGVPSYVTSLSSGPTNYHRFLGEAVTHLPTFRWSNGTPVPSFAVGASGFGLPNKSGRVYIYHYDSEEGIVESILTPASFTQNMGTGYSLATCDFNGDGASDLVVGCNRTVFGSGEVTIYLGGPDFDLLPDITLMPGDESQTFGKYVAGVGDLDGDGYDE
ncbi:hypothetical protein DRQ50_11330, partial [bacterium]